MRAKLLAVLALGLLGAAVASTQPALAESAAGTPARASLGPVHIRVRASAAAVHGPSVSAALLGLERAGAITTSVYQQDYATYVAAKGALAKLSGTRRVELGAVLANVQAIAAAGEFIPSRLPALFLTLERNRQWWTREPLLSSGERISFPHSLLIWQYYPGQGLELQWLATFGEGNGYYNSGHENANLRQLVSEILALATKRAGGIAWEYLFRFDGGQPPWTSGLSQGTALQVLARAGARFNEAADLSAAHEALGIFQTAPPQGVRVKTPTGIYYAEYTYAPNDRILNGFIQADVGLYDYTQISKDPLGLALFEAGDADARAIVPFYDTGGWSLYDQFGESNLNYHELLSEFLQHLCERTRKGEPYTPAATAPPTPTPTPAPGGEAPSTGGVAPQSAHTAATATPIAGDQIYCTTAQHFSADLHTPPVLALLSKTLSGATRAGVQISLSKIASVQMTIRKGTHVVWSTGATLEHGKPRLLWVTPASGGSFSVTLTATDLAGNFATASGTITVSRH